MRTLCLLLALPVLAAGMRTDSKTEQAQRSSKKIRLLLVRHGLSCANILSEYGKNHYAKMMHKNFLDPPLCDCGRDRTEAAAALLANEHVDYVLSSAMMRAIETAWLQFGHRKVHVIPHIGEEHRGIAAAAVHVAKNLGIINDADNSPREAQDQLSILSGFYPDIQVDYSYRNDTADEVLPSNWDAFEDFLEKKLLPDLEKKDPKDSYTLGIGTHSLFLRYSIGRPAVSKPAMIFTRAQNRSEREKICVNEMPKDKKGMPGKPHNNQILELFYTYDPQQGLSLEVDAGCHTLGGRTGSTHGVPGKPNQLCEADFARCIPVWRSLQNLQNMSMEDSPKDKTQDIAEWSVGQQRSLSGPVKCETYHSCGSFPQVKTAEQEWVDSWQYLHQKCERRGIPDEKCGLPERPDVTKQEVCSCHA